MLSYQESCSLLTFAHRRRRSQLLSFLVVVAAAGLGANIIVRVIAWRPASRTTFGKVGIGLETAQKDIDACEALETVRAAVGADKMIFSKIIAGPDNNAHVAFPRLRYVAGVGIAETKLDEFDLPISEVANTVSQLLATGSPVLNRLPPNHATTKRCGNKALGMAAVYNLNRTHVVGVLAAEWRDPPAADPAAELQAAASRVGAIYARNCKAK